jgi:hypothetical protein
MSFGWNDPPAEGLRGLGLLTLPITAGKHPDDYTLSPVVVKRKVLSREASNLRQGAAGHVREPREQSLLRQPAAMARKASVVSGREHGASGMKYLFLLPKDRRYLHSLDKLQGVVVGK